MMHSPKEAFTCISDFQSGPENSRYVRPDYCRTFLLPKNSVCIIFLRRGDLRTCCNWLYWGGFSLAVAAEQKTIPIQGKKQKYALNDTFVSGTQRI